MSLFLQQFAIGLSLGAIYGIFGICIVLIYKSTQIFNFAQGILIAMGALFSWTLIMNFHLPAWLAFLITIAFGAALGLIIERLVFRPMIGEPILAAILMTVCLMAVLKGLTLLAWGAELHGFSPPIFPKEPVHLGNVTISQGYIWAFAIAIVIVGIFMFFFRSTRSGVAMVATSEDHQLARSIGIPVGRIFSWSWIIATAASCAVAVILGDLYGVNIALENIGMKAFAVVLVGGLESIPGAFIAGLVLGAAEGLAAGYLDPLVGGGIRDVFPFIIAIFVLLIRPHGLFGWKRIERV